MTLGERVRELRRAIPKTQPTGSPWYKPRKGLCISLRELARRSHVNYAYICTIEKDKAKNPSMEILAMLANALGVDPRELWKLANKPVQLN